MKKLKISFIFSMCLFIAASVSAQTLDEVLANHFEATGQKKLSKVESMTSKGNLVQMGLEIPFIAYSKRPAFWRTEGTFQGMTFIQAYNGENGFSINPFAGSTEPQPMTADELKDMKIQADIDGMLWNYKEKGYDVSLVGKEDVEGTECYNVKVVTESGDEFHHFIDADSYLIIKTTSKTKQQGVEVEADSYMSNYMMVDGIALPGKIETRYNGETAMVLVFTDVKINEDIDDKLFESPSKE